MTAKGGGGVRGGGPVPGVGRMETPSLNAPTGARSAGAAGLPNTTAANRAANLRAWSASMYQREAAALQRKIANPKTGARARANAEERLRWLREDEARGLSYVMK